MFTGTSEQPFAYGLEIRDSTGALAPTAFIQQSNHTKGCGEAFGAQGLKLGPYTLTFTFVTNGTTLPSATGIFYGLE